MWEASFFAMIVTETLGTWGVYFYSLALGHHAGTPTRLPRWGPRLLRELTLMPQALLLPLPAAPAPPAYRTILFNGYSTMPCARAALSLGIRSRTVRSSMIVLTPTHSSSLSDEMVGR